MKIIYDIGAYNGDDIPYYLEKADLVVTVEANPTMIDLLKKRFRQIASGRLKVEGYVVTANESGQTVPFYLHKAFLFQSQFPRPPESQVSNFDEIAVKSKSLANIVCEHGTPHYLKIDVEHYDQALLRSPFQHRIFPTYVSAESHEIEVFSLFVSSGEYKAFKLVDGDTVPEVYKNHEISTASGLLEYSFPHHSSGPFGNDINGPWLTASSLFKELAVVGLGWKDIHVSNADNPER